MLEREESFPYRQIWFEESFLCPQMGGWHLSENCLSYIPVNDHYKLTTKGTGPPKLQGFMPQGKKAFIQFFCTLYLEIHLSVICKRCLDYDGWNMMSGL